MEAGRLRDQTYIKHKRRKERLFLSVQMRVLEAPTDRSGRFTKAGVAGLQSRHPVRPFDGGRAQRHVPCRVVARVVVEQAEEVGGVQIWA